MKKILLILFTVYGLQFTVAQSLTEKYNSSHPVTVVCDWDKPPYEFLNNEGEPSGSNIDIMRAVMKELNIPVKFIMKEWSTALKTFERHDADIILANARRYRKEPYYVSNNIINYNRIRVATHSDSTGMITFKQLEREGAVFKPGDYSASYFLDADSTSTTFMEFQTPKVALMGLLNGDHKYYVWGEEPLKWKIKELNLEGLYLNDVGIPISEVHVIGIDRQLIEQIDDQYSRLKQRGEIAVIQDRWFHPERIQKKHSLVWLNIIIGALALIAILYFFNRLARRHVKNATRSFTELNEMMGQALHMGNFIVMEYDINRNRFTNSYGQILPEGGLTLEEFTNRIHPDQQLEFKQKMRNLMEGRERYFELDKRWNAGTQEQPEWLNFNGHAISELDSNGHPAYIVNAIHDVTQELEEDKAARDLIHKYQVLSNIPFVAMSFYDKNGYLISLNDTMKELCGISGTNDSQHYWENVSMFDIPLLRGAMDRDTRDDIFFCQHMVYEEFGIDRYIESNIQPLFNADGDIANYICIVFDVTNARRIGREVHLLEKECATTQERIDLEHDQLYYLLINSERFLMRSNIEQETIAFYRSPETPEYKHSFSRFHRLLAPEDREAVMNILYDTTTRTPQEYTLHIIQPSEGQKGVVFHTTFNPVFDQQGRIIGHEGIASDITRISNTRRQLAEETKRAEDSVRMKSAFMASMTHELRTPLNAIVGFTSVLEALGDSPERAEYVRIIRNSSDMLQRLINDIIEASSLSDGPVSIEPQEVDFAAAFEDICLTLSQRVQEPAVEFQKENPYDSFVTTLDIGRVHQVLTNFVTNAVKFTKKGHIKVGYRYQESGVRSQETGDRSQETGDRSQETGNLYLYCEDTGLGIPKDKQQAVFERFVKLDEFVQGTGMGLAICKSIAERCGGEIGVNSEGEGKGSTFWMRIPCVRKS